MRIKKEINKDPGGRPPNAFLSINNCIFDSNKVFTLIEKYPEHGFIFYMKMLCFINKKDYFITWDDDTRIAFAKQMHIPTSISDTILPVCMDLDLFDKNIFATANDITSLSIQKRWIKQSRRSKEVIMYNRNILLDAKFIVATKVPGFKLLNDQGNELKYLAKAKSLAMKRADARENNKYDGKYVKAFAKAKWEDQSLKYRENTPKNWYESFIRFCNLIIKEYPGILDSDSQISLEEYMKLYTDTKFVTNEISVTLKMVEESTRNDSKIFDLFKLCLSKIRSNENSNVIAS